MTCLILAGGWGKRLGDLTKDTPKPLIQIGEKSVLEHIVDRLRQQGITKIIVKIHYLPEQIIKKLGDRVIFYYEPVLFNWEETLKHLKDWLQEDFMLINGDTINELDYQDLIKFHQSGTISVVYDDWRAIGTWIYPKEYFDTPELIVRPYRPSKLVWFDIGLPSRLEEARDHFLNGRKIV